MKKASEYRASAWKEWRAQMSQSSVIILVSMLIGMLSVSAIYGTVFWCLQSRSVLSFVAFGVVLLLLFFTANLLQFYLPAWFLALVRKQHWSDVKASYGRALAASALIILPNVLQELVSMPMNMTEEPSVVMSVIVLVVTPPVVLLVLWWTYAVSATLPFRLLDHPDRSVWQSIQDNMRMMKGYKFKLFCVDFMIMIWPIVILYALIFIMAIIVAVIIVLSPTTSTMLLLSIVLGAILLPFVIVMSFVIYPMLHIARAQFYEDMRAELEPVVEEQPEETSNL